MSDDLISRRVLLDIFSRNSIFEHITNAEGKNVIEIIKEQPTSYDMGKVIEDLEEKILNTSDSQFGIATRLAFGNAIEIVKSGGAADE